MKGKCKKCGFEGELHQVGRVDFPFVILQCPECGLIHSVVQLAKLKIKWKCKNEQCQKEFTLYGTMTVKPKMQVWTVDTMVIEKPCCPFCHSLEFEFVQETKE